MAKKSFLLDDMKKIAAGDGRIIHLRSQLFSLRKIIPGPRYRQLRDGQTLPMGFIDD